MDARSRRERVLGAYRASREAMSVEPALAAARFLSEVADCDDPAIPALGGLLTAGADFQLGQYDRGEARAADVRGSLIDLGEEVLAAEADVMLGNFALERGEYDEAARRYAAAASVFEDPVDLGRVYNNLGLVAWRTRDLARAEEHYRRALQSFGPDVDRRTQGNLLNNLGLVHEDRGERAQAEAEFRRAVEVLDGVDANFLANALSNLGDLLRGRGQLDEATALQRRALGLRIQIGHSRGIVGSRIALAQLALQRGQLERAEAELDAALNACREVGLRKQEADALELLAELHEAKGDPRSALVHLRQAMRQREEVFGQQMSDRVAALQVSFDARQSRLMAQRAQEENVRLTAAMREVEEASAVRSRFLATMSHELRTPLTGVIGAADLLRAAPMAPEQHRLVTIIGTAADALLSMINDVLDFSRIEAGKLDLAREVLDPTDVARQVVALVTPPTGTGVEVRVDVDPGVPRAIFGDLKRFRQVLLNLMANAMKFTERGFVELYVGRDGGRLLCRVTDTGIGIPAAARTSLFEPFVQADGSDTRRFGGTGLGLAITRRIVEAMGGQIYLASTEGVGSVFTVVLPLEVARVPPPEPASPPPVVERFSAVLVEDDDMVRGVLAELLTVCGADVTAVGSAEEGLEAVARVFPALVVMDVQMPKMDGITCSRELRMRYGPDLRILVVSGATATRDETAARAAGVDGWLAKPVSLRGLRHELERLGVRRR